MFETLNDLEKITKNKIRGIIQTPNKVPKDTNLLKLQKEILKYFLPLHNLYS